MKIFQKIVPYKLKRLIPMAMIAGLPFVPTGCSKVEVEKHDVEIELNTIDLDATMKTFDMNKMQELIQDKTVRYIYLSATDHWNSWRSGSISALRTKVLQPRIELSPKVRGRGDFDFKPGEASRVPADSLWYIQNGWTINKNLQR